MGVRHLQRLARARDLLSGRFDTTDCVLACYSGAGFDQDIRAFKDHRTVFIGLADLYR